MKYERLESSHSEYSKWNIWTHVFWAIDVILCVICAELKKNKKKVGLYKALFEVHLALKAVDNEFVEVANILKKGGTVPPINLPVPVVDDWGKDTTTADGIIETLRGIVQVLMAALNNVSDPSNSLNMVKYALLGLNDALDKFKLSLED
jgi:hypothetical protein